MQRGSMEMVSPKGVLLFSSSAWLQKALQGIRVHRKQVTGTLEGLQNEAAAR
jgi:hypothetical protein